MILVLRVVYCMVPLFLAPVGAAAVRWRLEKYALSFLLWLYSGSLDAALYCVILLADHGMFTVLARCALTTFISFHLV